MYRSLTCKNLPIIALDKNDLYSDVPGAVEARKILNFGMNMRIGEAETVYETVIRQNDNEKIVVETEKVMVSATDKGIELNREHVAYISYDRVNNKLESDIVEDSTIMTMDDCRYGSHTFMMTDHYALIFPVAEWLAKNKPYCYKVLEAYSSTGVGASNFNACWIRNLIKMALFDKADDFERCYKFSPEMKNYCAREDIDDIIRSFDVKAIPAQCRDWVSKNPIAANHVKTFTDLLAKITEKEDGNNAVIFCKYFERVVVLADRREYNFNSSVISFIDNLGKIIDMGYNSKDVLEYITRQNFYFSRPFSFPCNELGTLCDYAHMAQAIRGENYERFPSNLARSHNVLAANKDMLEKIDEETEAMFKEAVEDYKHLEGEVYIPKQKMRWVMKAPSCSKEIIDEGISLNHCVSSYVDLIAQRASQILFLRHADEPNTPLYTVEVIGGVVTEAKGNYNEELPEDAVEALKKFQKLWKGTV